MGHRFEIYADAEAAGEIITISKSFGIDAQIIGRVEPFTGKKVTIESPFGTFEY
jgi:phosphoribosylformylglycinamidine cyclo-ligase